MADSLFSKRDWRRHWDGEAPLAADPLAQVGRTVAGRPIAPEEIDRLVDAVAAALELGPADRLADLCCGNGVITARLAQICAEVVGVDYSGELIAVAQAQYAAANIRYLQRAADELTAADFPAGRPNKVCMNQGLQYFDAAMLRSLLRTMEAVGAPDLALFFTDVPDAARIRAFYDTPERWAEYERRSREGTEAVGAWWSSEQLAEILGEHGYSAQVRIDPDRFTGHYRFDLLARRR